MARYRRLPNIIEANKLVYENLMQIASWVNDNVRINQIKIFAMPRNDGLMVPTPNGHVLATFGDWIILNSGQFSIIKTGLFEKDHELLKE
jgi:hypothetical protein